MLPRWGWFPIHPDQLTRPFLHQESVKDFAKLIERAMIEEPEYARMHAERYGYVYRKANNRGVGYYEHAASITRVRESRATVCVCVCVSCVWNFFAKCTREAS